GRVCRLPRRARHPAGGRPGVNGVAGAARRDVQTLSRGGERAVRRVRPAPGPVRLLARRRAVVGEPFLLGADTRLLRVLRVPQRALVLAIEKREAAMTTATLERPEQAARTAAPEAPQPPRHIARFDRPTRALHAVIMVTFLGLSATGMPLLFSDAAWARL